MPASGRYLLRMLAAAPAPYAFDGTVWAPSSIFTGYAGEFSSSVSSFNVPTEGPGPLAAGDHTVVRARHYTALNAPLERSHGQRRHASPEEGR